MNEEVLKYVAMWTVNRDDYLLVYPDEDEVRDDRVLYSLAFNKLDKSIAVFEIDCVASEVKRRMYAAGVPIVRLSEIMHLLK